MIAAAEKVEGWGQREAPTSVEAVHGSGDLVLAPGGSGHPLLVLPQRAGQHPRDRGGQRLAPLRRGRGGTLVLYAAVARSLRRPVAVGGGGGGGGGGEIRAVHSSGGPIERALVGVVETRMRSETALGLRLGQKGLCIGLVKLWVGPKQKALMLGLTSARSASKWTVDSTEVHFLRLDCQIRRGLSHFGIDAIRQS